MGSGMSHLHEAPLHERAHLVAAAALLHDAGKVLQPAEAPLKPHTSNLRQMICPTDEKSGQSTHQHVLYTAAALEEAKCNYGRMDSAELFRIACYHHKPSPDSLEQNILTKADWLASGHDRRPTTEPGESISCLLPILSQVTWPHAASGSKPLGIPSKLLSLTEEGFLPVFEQDKNAYRQCCRVLSERLIAGLQTDFRSPTECIDALLGLTERVFHAVPASRDRRQQPDVTLFDHSRIVAAFAACLACQYEDGSRTAHELKGQFRLVGISLGSIQKFIFRVIPPIDERDRPDEATNAAGGLTGARGMARRLRARSLYVSLLSWLAARRVLDDLGLPATNLISNAGGRAILLLPDTDSYQTQITNSLKRIEQWYMQQIGGVLRLDIAQSDSLSDAAFHADNFAQTFRDLDHRLATARWRFGWPDLQKTEGWEDAGWIQQDLSLPIDRKDFNQSMAKLGQKLPLANYISLQSGDQGLCPALDVFGYRVSFHQERPASGLTFSMRVAADELTTPLFVTARHIPTATADVLARLQGRSFANQENLADGARSEGEVLTFEQIAQLSVDEHGNPIGQPMLGALKADVDRLGMILSYGLGQRVSFGRFGSLSRTLDLFFKGFLAEKLQTEFSNVYTIFAGGDDLFLVGPWYDLVRLIEKLRIWFGQLVCESKNLTFSAGLVFAGPTTPVNHLAHEAETALEAAKDSGRNRITIGSVTLSWEHFQAALKLHRLLLSESRPGNDRRSINPSFLYRLLQYGRMGERVRNSKPTEHRAPTDLKWRAQLSYDLKRNLPPPSPDRPGLNQIHAELLKITSLTDTAILQVAASLTLYVLRGNAQ